MKRLALAAALAAAFPACAFAQVPTAQERIACTPDGKKFCSAVLGQLGPLADTWLGHLAIGSCLLDNKASLSPACRKALAGHGL